MISYQTLIQDYPSLRKIVAVSKTKPIEAIHEAIQAGYTDFGENKAQELKEKAQVITDVTWHFIGHLQRNKVKDVVRYASWIHSVDSLRLIQELNKECIKQDKQINILIQVNLTNEEQKSGCSLDDLDLLLKEVNDSSVLNLKGLMVMGPSSVDLEETQQIFKNAKRLLIKHQKDYPSLTELSMGMSQDYKIAIQEGSTMIRIGSTLFGSRT